MDEFDLVYDSQPSGALDEFDMVYDQAQPKVADSKSWWSDLFTPSNIQKVGNALTNPWGAMANSVDPRAMTAMAMRAIPFGDEVAAGGSAAIDTVYGDEFSKSLDKRLSQARDIQNSFAKEHPVLDTAAQVAGALAMPIGTTVKATDGILATAGKVGLESGLWGAGTGFSQGEGGLENRLQNAKEGAITGAEFGAPLGAAAKIGSKVIDALPGLANSADRKSLGTFKSDYGRESGIRTIETPEDGIETYVKSSLDDLLENNKLGTSRDPGTILQDYINPQHKELSGKLSSAIHAYDNAGAAPVQPDFSGALNYLYEGKVPADLVDSYAERLGKIEQGIASQGQGKLAYIQQQKVALGKSYDPADKVKAGFDRAIYDDLKKTIEERVPIAKSLNDELSKYQIAEKISKRTLTEKENQSPISKAFNLMNTTGGAAAPGVIGGIAGGPPGALLGLAGGTAGRFLQTRTGQGLTARGLRSLRNVANLAPETAAIPRALGTTLAPDSTNREKLSPQQLSAELSAQKPTQQPQLSQHQRSSSADPTSNSKPTQTEKLYSDVFTPASDTSKNGNTPDDIMGAVLTRQNMKSTPEEIQQVTQEIDQDPYDSTVFEMESARGTKLVNPESSARGPFQLLKRTAASLGVSDPMNFRESYDGFKKLKAEIQNRFNTSDPMVLYAGHYLGAPVLAKVLNKQPLNEKEAAQVNYLRDVLLPRFRNIYLSKINQNDMGEV